MFLLRNILKIPQFTSHKIKNARKMSLKLSTIVTRLQQFAPLKLAEKFDNVGLLVDPLSDSSINNILLTNDLTENVLKEAIEKSANLIISYHPNIFHALKSVTGRTWKERIVVECIKNGIAVYSPHTTWDSVQGGVNDWLGAAFMIKSSKPIVEIPDDPQQGAGRYLNLLEPISVESAVKKIKSHIGINHLRLAVAKNKDQRALIETVALCAGAGTSVLNGVNADLYLTGEMLHHDVLNATQNGTHVILCNHSDSERGFLGVIQKEMQSMLGSHPMVFISTVDKDPLITV